MGEETSSRTAVDVSRRGGHVRLVVLLMLVAAFGHFNRISITVVGTEKLIPEYGISNTDMGMVYSGFLLCYTLAMLPGGWLIDRYGPRLALAVMCAGSAGWVALTGLTGVLGAAPLMLWGSLLVVRCLMGANNAPLHPASANLVGQQVPLSRVALCNGMVTFAACVGIAATYVGFGALMDRFGWQGAFYASSGLTALVFLLWVGLAPRPPHPAREARVPAPGALLALLRHRGLLCLTASYAAMGYFQYLFFYWTEFYFKDVLHLGVERSRFYTTLVTLANGVGMIVGGWLCDRVGNSRGGRAVVPVAGLVGSAAVLAAGLLTSHAELTLLCFTGAMGMLGLCEAPFWTTSVELGGRRGGTTAGLMNTGGNAGGLLAPVVTPQLSLYFGWQAGMGLAGLVAILGAVLWLGIDPRARIDSPERSEGNV